MKRLKLFIFGTVVFLIAACKPSSSSSTSTSSSSTSTSSTSSSSSSSSTSSSSTQTPEVVYGLPVPKAGKYIKDADVIQETNGDRYLVYVTNPIVGEEDNVIAIVKGEYDDAKGYAYGEEHVIVTPSSAGWDKFVGSASIVKGTFAFGGENYNYLLAYEGTDDNALNANSIGFAVAKDPLGTWVKVGSEPVLKYSADVYGENFKGWYAPSLINLDKGSIIRIFYTWADAYGHFTYFYDFDASDLNTIALGGYAMVPTNGNLTSGDNVTMLPNGDFAYDGDHQEIYVVKDYSPAASQKPRVSTRIELAHIDEDELYTVEVGIGWVSLNVWDATDTPDMMYERLYSATLVTDVYGHLLSASKIDIIYNVSLLEADSLNYIFSQKLLEFVYED